MQTSRFESPLAGYAQGLIIALLASFLILFPGSSDRALAITNDDSICDLTGTGAPSDPFVISDAVTLWEITDCMAVDASASSASSNFFSISNDIDVSGSTASTSSPIGFGVVPSFVGVLNGNGHVISGLSMSFVGSGIGLFDVLEDATISNLTITGDFAGDTSGPPPSSTTESATGALARSVTGSVVIDSVTISGTVTGYQYVGGFIGYAPSGSLVIRASSNYAAVSGKFHTGGLVGFVANSADIDASNNAGTISAFGQGGGLNGGGLIGTKVNSSTSLVIVSSHNSGALLVSYSSAVGGLVGTTDGTVSISDSYNSGDFVVTSTPSPSSLLGGLVGGAYSGSINVVSSYNVGNIVGLAAVVVGGLVGVAGNAMSSSILSSYNLGDISGGSFVGGLIGYDSGATTAIALSRNEGNVSATGGDIGGLVGRTGDNSLGYSAQLSIHQSYNTGQISAIDSDVGGLIGVTEEKDIEIFQSFNTGVVSGSNDVGGLIGDTGAYTYSTITVISDSYNVGSISSGARQTGGLIGEGDSDLSIQLANSYNAGPMSVLGDYSGLVGPGYPFSITSVYTNQVASSSDPTSYSPSTLAQMQSVDLYTGWDFDNIWGFGTCDDNNGLPMLRFVGAISYSAVDSGVSCTSTSAGSAPAPNGALYEGPRAYDIDNQVVPRGTTVVLTGADMNLVTLARAGTVALEIQEQTATSLKLLVGDGVALGSATLYLTAVNGTVYRLNAFTVVEGDGTEVVGGITKKVNAGSFKGYVALYALNYEGQRLSAKVGKDWVIVPSIPSATNNLYRHVEFTGPGVDCTVRIFIDRELVRTVYLTTK